MAKSKDTEEVVEKKKGGMGKILIIAFVGLLFIVGSTGGALYFFGVFDRKQQVVQEISSVEMKRAEQGRALYIPLDPPFVVSLDDDGSLRFLQINVSLMSRDKSVIEEIGGNTPRVKNDLLMLFSAQKYSELKSVEAREKLRVTALNLVQGIIKEIAGIEGVEELYFTSFVVQ